MTTGLCGVGNTKLKAKTRLTRGVKCFWEFTQAITLSINLMIKCFTGGSAKGQLSKMLRSLAFQRKKLQCVKMQQLNGAIFLKHINTIKTNSYWQCISHVSCLIGHFPHFNLPAQAARCHCEIFPAELLWSLITDTCMKTKNTSDKCQSHWRKEQKLLSGLAVLHWC